MNYFVFIFKSSLEDFARNKGRAFLTSLGILIGVMSVVLLMAFGLGLRKYINDQFESLGTNLLRVVPGQILKNGSFNNNPGATGTIQFDEKDITKLRRIKGLTIVAPIFTKSSIVDAGKNTESGSIYASTADVFKALNLKAEYGVEYTKTDVDKRSKVVVIGPKIAKNLFDDASSAVGRSVKIQGSSFNVIGVLGSKGGGGFGGPDLDSFIYMPYKTAYIFNTEKKFQAIIVKGMSGYDLKTLKEDINIQLLKRYKEDDFSVIEQTEILNAIGSIFGILNTVLVAIAAVSLVVGGIGIMNIMYVTVTERIKEIGIRRAIGARKADILYQFLIESVILSVFGGALGLTLSFIIVFFIQSVFPAYIDLQTIGLALGVSTGIGVLFGVFPAKKAADLSPIDAIRYE